MTEIQNGNLIVPMISYYHPELQSVPPMVSKFIDEDGNIVKPKQMPFHITLKPLYTLDQALQYFYKLNPNVIKSNPAREMGALKFIYKEMQEYCQDNKKINALDLLLFTIDIATSLSMSREQLKDVLGINNYKNEGLSLYESKININVEAKLKVGGLYE